MSTKLKAKGINVWCVVIRKKNGDTFLAHDRVGSSVYFVKREAFDYSKELRAAHFRAHVESGLVLLAGPRSRKRPLAIPRDLFSAYGTGFASRKRCPYPRSSPEARYFKRGRADSKAGLPIRYLLEVDKP